MDSRPIVLVAEDDVQLAQLTCEVVELAGFQALFRTSVAEAMDFLQREARKIVALVTDINLQSPMGGIELAVHVSEEWPDIAICVTSGALPERPKRLPEKAAFLSKPWRASELLAFTESLNKAEPPAAAPVASL